MNLNSDWIKEAVQIIQNGIADKLCRDNVTVYRCGANVIRVDINIKGQ